MFAGNTVNKGVLCNVHSHITLNVMDHLENQGTIQNSSGWILSIEVMGNLTNRGEWLNSYTYIVGTGTQTIFMESGAPIDGNLVMVSNIGGSPHQWYRDGGPVPSGTTSSWTVGAVNVEHAGNYHCQTPTETSRTITIAEAGNLSGVVNLPAAFGMAQNYPNPFNPATNIAFSLPKDSHVRLTVYNVRGQVVDVLQDGEMGAGDHTLIWRAQDQVSGVYLYRIEAEGYSSTRRMLLLK